MTSKEVKQNNHIPPDGGWGWMVVIGFSLSNLIAVPILQGFGLLYRDLLQSLEISATDMGIIINLNSSFGYLLGLMNGPILRTFGYRKVAIAGGAILFCGNFLTSTADSFTKFIIYYGLISSLGFNLIANAYSLAMNTYFVKKRSTATGIAMTITGLGPVIIPIVISLLLPVYGVRGTSMLLAGLTLHVIVGGMLLHPIKWHYRREPVDSENNKDRQIEDVLADDRTSVFEAEGTLMPRRMSISSDARRCFHGSTSVYESKMSLSAANDVVKPDSTWWSSSRTSLNSIRLQNDVNSKEMKKVNSANKLAKEADELNTLLKNEIKEEDETMKSSSNNLQSEKQSYWQRLVKFFDLDLFKDSGYVSISIGLSVAITGEYNFSLMTPFIFGDRGFDIKNTAFLMSTIATADIVSRFFAPIIGNKTNWTAKNLYLIALVFLLLTRFSLTFVETYRATYIVAILIGIAKGVRTVYMTLVLPNYVPIEKLASAAGLQAVINGLCLLFIGPLIGYVRDLTGNYNYCIYIMNLLTLTTIVLWTTELIYGYIMSKKKQPALST